MTGPPRFSPHVVERSTSGQQDGRVRNISTGLMRPLYTSCSEHHHAEDKYKISNSKGQASTTISVLLNSPTMPIVTETEPPDSKSSPFLCLPAEIRLQIYSLLVLPNEAAHLLPSYEKISCSTQDYFDYDKKQPGTASAVSLDLANPTLRIRTVDPTRYPTRYPGSPRHVRREYSVRADRFRARCMETTYHCVNNPHIQGNLGIMRVNKQIHAEVAEMFYSSYTFDFDTHIEAMIPFFSDLTPFARSCIKSIRIVKRALAYEKEFDKCEWDNALRYITSSCNDVHLRRLELGVVAGRPGPRGWDGVLPYSADDFEVLLSRSDGPEWMHSLLELSELEDLSVEAVVEHCPPGYTSSGMANFIRFSASIETGFSEFMRRRLLEAAKS